MGTVITRFEYTSLEDALHYSSYYSDLLNSYKNEYESKIELGKDKYILEFKIYGTDDRRKSNKRNIKRTGYLPESSTENS